MGYYEDACRLAAKLGMGIVPRDQPVECIAKTSEEFVCLVVDRMRLLGVDAPTLSLCSGIALDSVERLVKAGEGSLHDMRSILEALNLIPVCLPYRETEG